MSEIDQICTRGSSLVWRKKVCRNCQKTTFNMACTYLFIIDGIIVKLRDGFKTILILTFDTCYSIAIIVHV